MAPPYKRPVTLEIQPYSTLLVLHLGLQDGGGIQDRIPPPARLSCLLYPVFPLLSSMFATVLPHVLSFKADHNTVYAFLFVYLTSLEGQEP